MGVTARIEGQGTVLANPAQIINRFAMPARGIVIGVLKSCVSIIKVADIRVAARVEGERGVVADFA